MSRKRSAYRPRLIKAPVMKELHDQIAMGMHTAYATLSSALDENAFSMLARIFNMVGLAIEGDARFVTEMRLINSGALAMNQIGTKSHGQRATELELLPVRNAVNTIDALLPRLDVVRLHQANIRLAAL